MSSCTFVSAGMAHSCIVPGCNSRSNKAECKGIKFYNLPTTKKILQVWLLLIGRTLVEVSIHSRICSKYFIGGQKTKDSLPQIFPWQKHPANTECPSTSTHSRPRLSPSDIVNHDHSYCLPQVLSTHLTPFTDHSISLSSSTVNVETQTNASYFCIEQIADIDAAIHLYSGFSDYCTLIICFEF